MPTPEPLCSLGAVLGLLPDLFLGALSHDLTRYVLGAGGVYLLINRLLAARLAGRKIRADSPGWGQKRREILLSLRTVLIFALTGTGIGLGAVSGLYTIGPEVGGGRALPILLAAGLLIVLHDAWFYWTHRLIHRPGLFRRLHATHHRSRNPSPFTSYAFDSGEALLNALYLPLVLLVLPAHPLSLLIFTVHMMIRNAIGHCGYELFPARANGRPLFDWMTSVTHHDLHHADARWNYGLYFTWWDRWCGSEHPDYQNRFAAAARPLPAIPGRTLGVALAPLLLTGMPAPEAAADTASRPPEAVSVPAPAQDIQGLWATPGLGAVIRLEPCPGAHQQRCGRVLWAWAPETWHGLEVGGRLIHGLQWNGRAWSGGELHNPEDGRIYTGSIRRAGPARLHLEGCAFIFCQSQNWRALDSLTPLFALLREQLALPAS